MAKIRFDKIYFDVSDEGYANILFLSNTQQYSLYFDGINFSKVKEVNLLLKKLSLFNYDYTSSNLYVERITQDFDIYFIEINNGDIFQIYSMMNDENDVQKLIVFDKKMKNYSAPSGISVYEAAVERANEGEEVVL